MALPTAHTDADRAEQIRRFLADEVWAQLPADDLGTPLTKAEWEEILGYGPDVVEV